jgi:membrane fusion protein, copper/silver efflux system
MRRIFLALAVVAAIAASYELGRHNQPSPTATKTGRRVLYYVDPMHTAYRSDKPGVAPDCGMKLEPVYAEDERSQPLPSSLAQLPPGAVHIDGATQRLMGIRLAEVERGGAARLVRAVGRVLPEDTRVYHLNPGVDGFIRETYEDSVGMRVKKDQKLATFYAPEVLAPASGFLAAVQGVPGAAGKDGGRTMPFPGALSKQGVSSVQGFTDRLRNLGVSDVQINQMAESHQLPESIDVVAPADGFIFARNISAGQHFERGMEFYRIVDLSRVWVVAEVYEQETPYLHPGGAAQITLKESGRRLPARISESLPQSEAGGGTVKLRLEVDNPGFILRPEMLVDVEIGVRLPEGVSVPLDAVVNSGSHSRVYVTHGDGVFEPREVETGWRAGERVEILRGLQPGEQVVAAATFLVDSESRLKAPLNVLPPPRPMDSVGSMLQPKETAKIVKDPSCGMPVDSAQAKASGNTLVYGGTPYYFCSKKCKLAFQNERAVSARLVPGS